MLPKRIRNVAPVSDFRYSKRESAGAYPPKERLFMRSQLLAVAAASPPFELRTEDVIGEATRIFSGRHLDFERLMPVFANTGIRRRQSVKPYSWFRSEQGWPERTAAYVEGATELFRKAATDALAQAKLAPDEIDTIVTVSSTGIATPSIEARVMHELGFHRNVNRIPVFGLGCAGGATGLSLAARLAQAPAIECAPGRHRIVHPRLPTG